MPAGPACGAPGVSASVESPLKQFAAVTVAAPSLTYLGFAVRPPRRPSADGALLACSSCAEPTPRPENCFPACFLCSLQAAHLLARRAEPKASPGVGAHTSRLPPTKISPRFSYWHPGRPQGGRLRWSPSLLLGVRSPRTSLWSPCPRCLLPGVTGPCLGSGEASQGPDVQAWAQGRTQVMAEAQHMQRPRAGMDGRRWERW